MISGLIFGVLFAAFAAMTSLLPAEVILKLQE
jgi:hypothetical protein